MRFKSYRKYKRKQEVLQMDKKMYSHPLSLRSMQNQRQISEKREMELVKKEVILYQWEALK